MAMYAHYKMTYFMDARCNVIFLVISRDLYAKMVGVTSNEGFLVTVSFQRY